RVAEDSSFRTTDFLKSGKVPEIWKSAALFRLHQIDRAILSFKEDAFTVRLIGQRKTATADGKAREFLDKIEFSHRFESGDARDFLVAQFDLARPAAAGSASSTFIKDR